MQITQNSSNMSGNIKTHFIKQVKGSWEQGAEEDI
jgi:hypothetical protein